MLKHLWDRFRRDRGVHKATVHIDFFPQDVVTPSIFWNQSQDRQNDTVTLVLHYYARILYELAELNEGRVARELMRFVDQVAERVLSPEGSPGRPRLPLGQLRLVPAPPEAPVRSYQADFYQFKDGHFRLEFQGSLGKESFYLPGGFLVLLQSCLDNLEDEPLTRLARGLGRLHGYYRYRRDFWEGSSLSAAPAFALGPEELVPEEAVPEV
jgi:hypothetical protein